jgi:Mg-chelatase subunit ChlD
MISELFIEKSVVFHQPSAEKVEQNNDAALDQKDDEFGSTQLLEKVDQNSKFGSTQLLEKVDQNSRFGSTFPKGGKGGKGGISLKAISSPLTESEQDFIFQIDCSGSMSDICSDGRTKMQHILHTLKNMILYFKENPSLKVNVTIHAFDDNIFKIVDRTIVDESSFNTILTDIDKIVPRNCTNIEKALQDTKEYIAKLSEQYPTTTKTHIFMTDGQVTAGNGNHADLLKLVDNTNTNVFIGFGLDHDATLLNVISGAEKSSYYFIDKLENAGLVYGEILHGIVYKFLENVEISITNGLIYNYNTNTWNPTLRIGNVASESSKFYHITGNTSSIVQVTGKRSDTGEEIQTIIPIQEETADLTKYLYRQRTQELLFRVNFHNKNNENDSEEYIETFKNLKAEMQEFFDELKKYMSDNNLTDDVLLKNLCDDIYICHSTFGTSYGHMYCTARGNSQGQQRAYATTHLPNQHERRNTIYRSNRIYQDKDEYEDEEDLQHEVSDSIDTPYCSQTMTQVMRSVSARGNSEDLETQVEY